MLDKKMPRRRVILIVNYGPDQQQSMLKFGQTLYGALQATGCRVETWESPRAFAQLALMLPAKLHKWSGYLDKLILGQITLVAKRMRHPGAIWHVVDHSNAVYAWCLPKARLVVTCHDCIAIDDALARTPFGKRTGQPVGAMGVWLQRWIAAGLRRASKVACVSSATAADLERLVRVRPDRTCVVYNGMVQDLVVPDRDEAMRLLVAMGINVDADFMFMVGSDLLRKNRANAIRAFDLLRAEGAYPGLQLVVAGAPMLGENQALADSSAWRGDIVEVGMLGSDALAACYRYADVVLFPSLAEGFGLPIIEAQRCGAALVTSARAPMDEVAGEGALQVNPEDPAAIASGVRQALAESGSLRERGIANAARFSVEAMRDGYLSLYRSLEAAL